MNVVELGLRERAEHDTWRLLGASQTLGECHPNLAPRLHELAEDVSAIAYAWQLGDMDLLKDHIGPLAQKASALGLNRIARVAHTTDLLTRTEDAAALAANAERLMRLSRALFEDACRHSDQI